VTKRVSDTAAITVTMVAAYAYDGYGRRVRKQVTNFSSLISNTHVIIYLYDGLDIIGAQLTVSGIVTETYYYLTPSPTTGSRRPLEMERLPNPSTGFTGDRYWYQADGLGSVVALTDESGDLLSPYLYDEYGQMLAGEVDLQIFAYTAQNYDPETKLFHFHAREYDPKTGIWLQQDLYRGLLYEPITLHRYGYVGNSPASIVDTLGYKWCWPWDVNCYREKAEECYNNGDADCVYRVYKHLAWGAGFKGLPTASRMMYNHLGEGKDQIIGFYLILQENSAIAARDKLREKILNEAQRRTTSLSPCDDESLDFNYIPGSEPVRDIENQDLWYAMGQFWIDASANVRTTKKKDDSYEVFTSVDYSIEDEFNWHPELGWEAGGEAEGVSGFKDEWGQFLVDEGKAKEFTMRSNWSERRIYHFDSSWPQSATSDIDSGRDAWVWEYSR